MLSLYCQHCKELEGYILKGKEVSGDCDKEFVNSMTNQLHEGVAVLVQCLFVKAFSEHTHTTRRSSGRRR